MDLSIIIPTLNERHNIAILLKKLRTDAKGVEVIVSDADSTDGTLELAKKHGAITVSSRPGRGAQLNRGASLARGETLLFLHADTSISEAGISAILRCMESGRYRGGAFRLALDRTGILLRCVVYITNLRSRFLHIVYGDQGIFVDREHFKRLNGFEEIPLMEDYDFFRRLKKSGKTLLIKEGLHTSSRRWEQEGVLFTTLRNWTLLTLYLAGVPPRRLRKWYPHIR